MERLSETEKYIIKFLNSKSTALSFYVPRILDPLASDAEKENCIKRAVAIIKEVNQTLTNMNIYNVHINSFFNQLYLLKDSRIQEVNDLLEAYDYIDQFNGYDNLLKNKALSNQTIDYFDEIYAEFVFENHIQASPEIYVLFLKPALLKQKHLNYNAFECLFIDYAISQMKPFYSDVKCHVVDQNQLGEKEAYSLNGEAYFSREDIQNLYFSGNYNALKNIFHEACHIKQYREIFVDKKDDAFTLKQIKEEILSSYYPGYYANNYENISYEVEAEMFAITYLLKLLKSMNITFKNKTNPYSEVINSLMRAINNNNRITSEGLESVDELFDFVIIHRPELLDTYPQLNKEYELAPGSLVIRKDGLGGRKD